MDASPTTISEPRNAPRSRRSLLGGGIAALSALAALVGGGRAARAATGDPAKVGQLNTATQPTTIRATAGNTALMGQAQGNVANANGLFGQSDSVSGRGVLGIATATSGTTFGVLGESRSPAGRAVRGYASATTGTNFGVSGQTASGSGIGVQGVAPPPNGVGVLGSGPIGVRGASASPTGRGVVGSATATTGSAWGVYGRSDAPTGIGVRGESKNTGAEAFGIGVYGLADGADGIGVWGGCFAERGLGVQGLGETGVRGEGSKVGGMFSTGAGGLEGSSYAVYARVDRADGIGVWGGCFEEGGIGVQGLGEVGVRGNGSKVGGWFSADLLESSVALQVEGRVQFTTCGVALIGAGVDSVVVSPGVAISPDAVVLATLQGDPGGGVVLSHVITFPGGAGGSFTIHLTGNAASATKVAWFLIG